MTPDTPLPSSNAAASDQTPERAATLSAALNRVLEIAISDTPLGETLDAIVREVEASSQTGVLASILLVDESGKRLRHGAAPSLPQAYNEAIDVIAIGGVVDACGTAAQTGKPLVGDDIASDPFWADFRELAQSHGFAACWSTPILSPRGELLGIFAMYHREPRERRVDDDDLVLVDVVVRSVALVIARKTAEDRLRKSEARLRFLSTLDEALVQARDAVSAMSTATQMLGRHLEVSRCAYADVEADSDGFTIRADYTAPGVLSSAGAYHLDLFGPRAVDDMHNGRTLVVRDVDAELAPGEGREMFQSIGIEAIVCCPLVRDGALAAMMAVHHSDPRDWNCDEIALVEAVVERCWAHIERIGSRARLRESETKFHAIANTVDQMIWSTTPDGYHDYYNDRWYDYTGVPYGSTDGEGWNDMFHPDDRERSWQVWRDCLATGEPYHIEYRLRHRSGAYRWVIGRAQCERDEQGRIVRWYGTCTDIDDLKATEAALRQSRDQLAAESQALEILNSTGTQVAAELGLETVVQKVVDAGLELTGARFGAFFYNVTDELGESYMLYTLAGADRSQFENFGMPRATQVFAPTFRGDGVIRSSDIMADPRYGQNSPHQGMPKGHLPVRSYLAVPVTSRSGEVMGGLFFGHEETGVFSERSERVMTGLAAQAAIAIDNARLFDAVQKANAELEERVEERTAELEQAHEALRQSQKMEAVGQLTGGIAHDFNNLLAGISGSLEIIERRLSQGRTDGVERFLQGAQTSAQRAAALTQRLLAFSRRQTLDPKPTDVNRLVFGMEDLIRRTVGPQIKVEIIGAGGLWLTRVDAAQLESALLNLSINARDAMPDGGRLTIETANKWLDERAARERDLPPGQYISVCVTDTGTGIPKDIVERIFDPFFTTKPIGQGTGLGLSMIHGFVRQSGGQVRVYSELDQGTTMCLYLPRYAGDLADDEELAHGAIVEAGAGETVLVVDDEETVRMLIVEVLTEAGYRAIEADDGPSALKVLNSDTVIDLLITDVGLPGGMNGRQIADAARATRPDLRILFVTGYAENAAVGNGHLEPGMEVITKPFAMTDLANKITDLLEAAGPAR